MLIILTSRKAAEAVSRRNSNHRILFSTSLLSNYPIAKTPLLKQRGFSVHQGVKFSKIGIQPSFRAMSYSSLVCRVQETP